MSEISALEQRLSIALTRISAATEIIVSSSYLQMNATEIVDRNALPAHLSKELEQLRLNLMQSQATNVQQVTVIADLNSKIRECDAGYIAKRHTSRLLSDAYGKGIVRGQVENTNSRAYHKDNDATASECIKTSQVVSFFGK